MVQLAAHLAEQQKSQPLAPLEAETVIVQSNDLSRWLSLFLAGQHGIVSHIDFPYPSAYIWALFRKLLPNVPQQSGFSTDAMAWRIFELLPSCRHKSGFEPIDAYLGESTDTIKMYALAHGIADSFDQYLMYRPDWIQAWEQGDAPHWQAMLWQMLTAGDEPAMHRANLLTQLHDYLATAEQRPKQLPSRISIFGISALPPVYMDLFALIANHCEMTLYFLSPSADYWGDLLDQKTQTKRLIESPEQQSYLTVGHPLLSNLGKQGQEFFEQLQSYQPEELTLFMPPQETFLLGQLQSDIFNLRDVQLEELKRSILPDDDSISIHSCHSAMREIEVLHDQLLALLERHPELSPTDIVVMTPDIDLYTPWIEAVFSCTQAEHRIPYGIADSGIKLQSPILAAFSSLLQLPQSRFDVESIMGLLSCPAIQHRFSLDEEQLELIRRWLRETYTRWGLSAQDKADLDLPEIDANTWRAGLDRLLLGYAMPLSTDDEVLFDGKLGFNGITGDRADTMAQLCAFINKLDRYRKLLKASLDAKQWQQNLLRLLDDFFLIPNNKLKEDTELTLIRKTLDLFVETTELANYSPKMNIDLVTEWIKGHLDKEQTQTRFMGQGVTFCGMVPMRSVPFSVVCLIGMNDSSYPRRQAVAGFDLLSEAKHFRKGDRSRRDDDRYLFLESILSAQSHLYISYVGAGISDNATIPPSVLVSDLRDVLQQSFETDDGHDIWQKLLTSHPLQSFSRRYFDQKESHLFSYVTAHCPPKLKKSQLEPWFASSLPEANESAQHINLHQLLSFFSHPGRYCLQQRLGLRLDADEEQLEIREPFSLDGLQAWKLRQQLLDYRLHDKNIADAKANIQATGALPHAYVGEEIFDKQLEKVDSFAEKLMPDFPDEFLSPVPFELSLGEFILSGQLEGITVEGGFDYRMGKTKGNQLLTLWLRHLILNSLKMSGVQCQSRLITEDNDYHFQPVAEAKVLLQELLSYYWQGLHAPLPFFSNTSYAFAKAHLNGGRANPEIAMNTAWRGGKFQTGEMEDLYYQQLYASPPLDDEFKELALAVYQPLQAHLLDGKL